MTIKNGVLLGTRTCQVSPARCQSHLLLLRAPQKADVGFRHIQHMAAAFPHLGLYLPILVPGTADLPDHPSLAEQERGQECGAGRAAAAWHQRAPNLSSRTTDKDTQAAGEHSVPQKLAEKMLKMSLQVACHPDGHFTARSTRQPSFSLLNS